MKQPFFIKNKLRETGPAHYFMILKCSLMGLITIHAGYIKAVIFLICLYIKQ